MSIKIWKYLMVLICITAKNDKFVMKKILLKIKTKSYLQTLLKHLRKKVTGAF